MSFRTTPGPSLHEAASRSRQKRYCGKTSHSIRFSGLRGSLRAGSISLPVTVIANLGVAIAGREPMAPRDPISVGPTSAAMRRLQRTHAAIGRLAVSAPEPFDRAKAARSMEQALLGAVVSWMEPGEWPS